MSNLSSCTSTELFKYPSSCRIAIKNHIIKRCEIIYQRAGKDLFWLNQKFMRGSKYAEISQFSWVQFVWICFFRNYMQPCHTKLVAITERVFFQREGSLHIVCYGRRAFFTREVDMVLSESVWGSYLSLGQYLVIFIGFDSKLYRNIIGIPMGTNCAPVAVLFFLIWERLLTINWLSVF